MLFQAAPSYKIVHVHLHTAEVAHERPRQKHDIECIETNVPMREVHMPRRTSLRMELRWKSTPSQAAYCVDRCMGGRASPAQSPHPAAPAWVSNQGMRPCKQQAQWCTLLNCLHLTSMTAMYGATRCPYCLVLCFKPFLRSICLSLLQVFRLINSISGSCILWLGTVSTRLIFSLGQQSPKFLSFVLVIALLMRT
jgi:hypothetical protein